VPPPSMASAVHPQPRPPSLGTVQDAYVRGRKPGIDRMLVMILILLCAPGMALIAVIIRIALRRPFPTVNPVWGSTEPFSS
jgi:hypothetical protein